MIRRKLISDAVASILNGAGVTCAPVDVKAVAEAQGAIVVEEPHSADTSGFLFRAAGTPPVIGVNSTHPITRRRFTIGHEIAHLVLHTKSGVHVDYAVVKMRDSRASEGVDEEEMEANRFAAELLMPEPFLEADLAEMGDIHADDSQAIKKLAHKYRVSEQAMTIRLTSLGILRM